MSSQIPTPAKLHLLGLPLEVRNLVWEFVLSPHLQSGRDIYKRRRTNRPYQLSLFTACRQIYNEALPLYYSKSMFRLYRNSSCTNFINDIGDIGREFLRGISLAPSPETISHRASFTSALSKLEQLERLEIRLDSPQLLQNLVPFWRDDSMDTLEMLDRSHNNSWLVAISGLSSFKVKMNFECSGSHPQGWVECPSGQCSVWPSLARDLEDTVRAEVYQPRAKFRRSPRYLERQALGRMKY